VGGVHRRNQRHTAGGDEVGLEAGEQLTECSPSRVEQEVGVLALRDTPSMLGIVRQVVALKNQHLVEVGSQRTRGGQARHAAAENHCRTP
jgi:hypothetical protein